jgi:hypothetical protein
MFNTNVILFFKITSKNKKTSKKLILEVLKLRGVSDKNCLMNSI